MALNPSPDPDLGPEPLTLALILTLTDILAPIPASTLTPRYSEGGAPTKTLFLAQTGLSRRLLVTLSITLTSLKEAARGVP